GVTMVTALVSALGGIPVRSDVAMTGEITLSGKVLPIGGLREKTMVAYKAGIKTVIVPKANIGDMDEIDDAVKLNLEFVFAEKIQDVLDVALTCSCNETSVPMGIMPKRKETNTRAKASQ
ncbi:MAG: endopeptidase La, partial [Ruminococcus sp.]|nr:endopeptidase La [Ruminococcus sp.]